MARKRALRRSSPAIAVSLAVHALLFLAVGLIPPRTRLLLSPARPPVEISLLPPMSRERVHQRAARSAAARPLLSGGATTALRVHTPPPDVVSTSTAPSNTPQAPSPGDAPSPNKPGTSYAPGPLPAEDGGQRGVQAMLRGTVGCDFGAAAHLSREEKDRCAQRFADGARKADPFNATPPEKLSSFMAEAAANARRRAAHDQSVPMSSAVVACEGAGSNFGTGCLPAEAIHHFKQN